MKNKIFKKTLKTLSIILIFAYCKSSFADKLILAEMDYYPLNASCKDFMNQAKSTEGKNKNEFYIESEVLNLKSNMAMLMGLRDAKYIDEGMAIESEKFLENVLLSCNKKSNLDTVWAKFLIFKTEGKDKDFELSKYYYYSCGNVYHLISSFASFNRTIQEPEGSVTLYDLLDENQYIHYNDSVLFKNYLLGFSQTIGFDFFETVSILTSYCADKPVEKEINKALSYLVENAYLRTE